MKVVITNDALLHTGEGVQGEKRLEGSDRYNSLKGALPQLQTFVSNDQ